MTEQTYTAEQMLAGALFDFLGFLTTLEKPVTLSARHEASSAVRLLEVWAANRQLSLDEALVKDWKEAARMMREQSPASINEALNVIEHWGIRGNTLSGDDVDRFRALVDKIAPRDPVKVTDDAFENWWYQMMHESFDFGPHEERYTDVDEYLAKLAWNAALESFAARPAAVPDGWFFASGPEGHFYAQSAEDANNLLARSSFDRDEWTVTMLAAAPEVTK
jgi:hypothetical protein